MNRKGPSQPPRALSKGGRRSPSSRVRTQPKTPAAFQNELLLARDFAEAVIEAVPPLLVLDKNLRVHTANESFRKTFKVSLRDTVGQLIYELGHGQWNIPELRTLLENVLPRKSLFKGFELTADFGRIGRRTLRLSGRQVDHLQKILLLIEDITEWRDTQIAVQTSEIRYRRLFEAARDGILILDPLSRQITDANPFMSELLDYKRSELIGRELWEIGLLKDELANQLAFRELKKKHYIRYENLPLQNKSGESHQVEFVSNLYDEGGHSVIQCNIRDITERKQAEAALRQSEERYRTLFNSIDEGFCVIEMLFDPGDRPVDYRFLEVNPSFEKQTGMRNVTGNRVRQIIPDHEAHWFAAYGKVALTGEAVRFVNQAKGLNRWFDVYAFRLGGGESRKVALLFTDITRRREAEHALITAKNEIGLHAQKLEQVVAERTSELRETIGELEGFSYSVSHDMRAPLRAMQSYAAFLVEEYGAKLDQQGVGYLEHIMRSALRLDRLIQDVLSYTRILHVPLPMVSIDLDRLMRDVVEVAREQSVNSLIEIKGLLPKAAGNEALLTQVFSNLLSNGLKFVARGTIPRVEIAAEQIDGSVRIKFTDNGIGIARENQVRIFRLFERIHPPSEYEGTGIGLTIVRKAIERMSAEVGVESEPGKGSSFWVQLRKAENHENDSPG